MDKHASERLDELSKEARKLREKIVDMVCEHNEIVRLYHEILSNTSYSNRSFYQPVTLHLS